MLKHVLLASAVLISTPALAQNKPADPQNPPPPTDTTMPTPTTPQTAPVAPPAPTTAPTTAAPTAPDPAAPDTADTQPAPAAPAPIAPAPNAQAATPAPADPATAAATPAAPAAPALGAGIAAVVNAEFGTYDKNGDGKLSKAEFGSWMFALKQKADPSAKDDAGNKAWTTQAFAQADSDKSKSISKDELTNFLSQGQKAS